MPLSRFYRLPLPNLRTYTFLSVLALSGCMYYAKEAIQDPDWNIQDKVQGRQRDETFNSSSSNDTSDSERSFEQWVSDMTAVMTREPVCVWVSEAIDQQQQQ